MYNCQFDQAVFTPGADPEFPIGNVDPFGGCGPPTWVLSGENVHKNEKNLGPVGGVRRKI